MEPADLLASSFRQLGKLETTRGASNSFIVDDIALEIGNAVLRFEPSKYTYSGKIVNFKIFHSFKGGQNAAFPGGCIVPLDPYFLMSAAQDMTLLMRIHKILSRRIVFYVVTALLNLGKEVLETVQLTQEKKLLAGVFCSSPIQSLYKQELSLYG
ncbi:hypothetical protein DUI87_11216 [Hirundo rustica rustica]|uniref:Uncharacterized protein n=1 Tax=Hirundo rustica rustica TaxID=333673 RepID=A0A3M0KHK0_HIRRU|nr:hypothetical protein DUI87_11216 [Hirundo rustica rustica]